MISQKCPRCHSDRVRRGYRSTRIWSKIFFRYNLLCNACNWQFKGFAVPFTVTDKPSRKKRKRTNAKQRQAIQPSDKMVQEESDKLETDLEEYMDEQADISAKAVSSNRIRVRKKVRIRQS